MSSESAPRVSVVMPCHNGGAHNTLPQSYKNWELHVVDDGSTDDSLQILEALACEDRRIRAQSQTRAGPSAARNRALHDAAGELVAFLDADDTWHLDFLKKMTGALLTPAKFIAT